MLDHPLGLNASAVDEPSGERQQGIDLSPNSEAHTFGTSISTQYQGAIAAALYTKIARFAGHRRNFSGVDDETDFAGQLWELRQPVTQFIRNSHGVVARLPFRSDEDVPAALPLTIAIDKAQCTQALQQSGPLRLAHTADLQVGASCQVYQAAAMRQRRLAQGHRLRSAHPAKVRLDPHQQPIARRHRMPGIGAPTPYHSLSLRPHSHPTSCTGPKRG
ncbi:hypothetical protein NRB_08590 [Novosphingobium sp. 11B]